jgi:adenosylcobinamide-phosphate synthase
MRRALAFLTPLFGASEPRRETLTWFRSPAPRSGSSSALWWGAERVWPAAVAAAIVVAADLALTGLLHVDGLADSADGLLLHLDRSRRLEVMATPDVGAFGVATVAAVLLLRWAALATTAPSPLLLGGLWCASRTVMAVTARTVPYARPGGLASSFLGGRALPAAIIGGALAVALAFAGPGVPGVVAVGAVVVGAAAVVLLARRRIGGFTRCARCERHGRRPPARRGGGAMVIRPLGAAAGVMADRLLGEPPVAAHPVAGFGAIMRQVETHLYRDARRPGAAHAALGVGLATAAGAALRSPAAAAYVAVAGRSLAQTALAIEATLDREDLLRNDPHALAALVGREPSQLDEPEIARAVVESVAENTVDAVVAPALWAAAAGAPGVFAYRAVNTLDAMVGHRSVRYEQFGWASARLDDLAGLIPARVTAGLVAAVRPRSATRVARAVRDAAPAHPSPNAGVAEARSRPRSGCVSAARTGTATESSTGRPRWRPHASARRHPRAVRLSGT